MSSTILTRGRTRGECALRARSRTLRVAPVRNLPSRTRRQRRCEPWPARGLGASRSRRLFARSTRSAGRERCPRGFNSTRSRRLRGSSILRGSCRTRAHADRARAALLGWRSSGDGHSAGSLWTAAGLITGSGCCGTPRPCVIVAESCNALDRRSASSRSVLASGRFETVARSRRSRPRSRSSRAAQCPRRKRSHGSRRRARRRAPATLHNAGSPRRFTLRKRGCDPLEAGRSRRGRSTSASPRSTACGD